MDGIEATQKLKEMMLVHENLPKTPIVAVTAAHCQNEEEKQKYYDNGFDEFGTNFFKFREAKTSK